MTETTECYKNKILQTIGNLINGQNNKGLKKYGHSLEKCDPDEYDWNVMIIEELIDALQYQHKENQRLREMKELTLLEYQELSKRTLPSSGTSPMNLSNYAMGLAGEAGEVVDLLKKHLHHGHELDRQAVIGEIGDVLHYAAGLCTMLGIDFEGVATSNIKKLEARYPNGFSEADSINRSE